jgi:hypothetical protein
MNIEFQTPAGKVDTGIINHVREELLKIHRMYKIPRAEVYFREVGLEKVCKIDLSIVSDHISVQRITESFERSAKEVIKELDSFIKEKVKQENFPSENITSTVKV